MSQIFTADFIGLTSEIYLNPENYSVKLTCFLVPLYQGRLNPGHYSVEILGLNSIQSNEVGHQDGQGGLFSHFAGPTNCKIKFKEYVFTSI